MQHTTHKSLLPGHGASILWRGILPALALSLALTSSAGAQSCPEEPPLQNWSGAGTTSCPCFVAGEEAGAVLQAPAAHYPIEILRVGIGWGSLFGGAPESLEQSINIYGAGLPNPGSPIFSLDGPVLTDGAINEFDLEPVPGEILIANGPFTVTLEFMNDNAGDPFAPSLVHDGNGCNPGKNVVYAIPGGWYDACNLGVSGNWLVHVIYRPVNCGGSNQTYCISAPNSVGSGAQIGYFGSTSITANDLILTCTGLPAGQMGIFFYGPNQIQVPFGDGWRCVGGQVTRFLPPAPADVFGNVARIVDYTAPPANGGPGWITAGSDLNFQFWYRDPAAGGTTFNLSNGQNLVFIP